MNSRLQQRIVLSLLLVLFAVTLRAAQDPVTARGFAADKVYHFNGLDTVDQFNGNLMIAIPIGEPFRSNGSLRYTLNLQYNSNVWDHQELAYYLHGAGSDVVACEEFNWWGGGCFGEDAQYRGTEAYPGRLFNAGLGWSLGLGSIRGFVYTSPDGAEHHFFDKLHGSPTAARPAGAWLYTRDGTYLRMKNTAASNKLTIELPDGLQHRFVCLANCGDADRAEYVLDQMTDPFGNILYVTRSAEPSAAGGEWTWTLHEKVSSASGHADHTAGATLTSVRSHKIVFERDLYSTGKYRIVRVELDGFGDAVSTYTFHYSYKQVYRGHDSTWGGPEGRNPLTADPVDRLTLSMLDSVDLPAGAGSYQFQYVLEPESEGYANDLDEHSVQIEGPTQQWTTSHYAGRLSVMTLPTGGGVGYTYGQRRFFRRRCQGLPTPALDAIGIRKRYLIGNDANDRPWLYFADSYDIANDCNGPREFASTVIDPSGNATATYFWVFAGSSADPTGGDDYGLPVTHDQPGHDGRLLSTRVYQCPFAQLAALFDGANAFANARKIHSQYVRSGETASCGQPVRSTYVQYENSGTHCRDDSPTGCVQANRRTRAESTKYHDDGDAATWTVHSDFDGLGHYRTTTTGGDLFRTTFPAEIAGGDERVVTTRYNPAVTFDPVTFAVNLPATWLLDTYDQVVTTERQNGSTDPQLPAASTVVKYKFNATTGFLEERRVLLGEGASIDTDSAKDLIVRFARTRTPGEALVSVRETYFGGDGGTKVDPGADDAEFAIERLYQYGGPRKTAYLDCSLTSDFLVLETNVVDAGTGLVKTSTDMSGLATSYAFDALGRLTGVTPAGLAPTTYTYTNASGNAKASVTGQTKSGSTVLRKFEVRFDGFGRIAEERTVMPDGTSTRDAVRETRYYANGRTWKISTMGGNTPAGWTTYEKYDPFGRVERMTSPDGFETTYSYKGVREEKTTTSGLALGSGFGGTATEVSRTVRYDRFGRIVQVLEDSDATAGGSPQTAKTRYEYDLHGELHKVIAAGQNDRELTRDKRGLLTAERHPELDDAVLRYQNYDARGNFRSKVLRQPSGAATPFDVIYQYDAAERLAAILRTSDKRPLKTFNYYGNAAAAGAKGKLKTATRANVIPDPLAIEQTIELGVTQRFEYHSSTGLLEKATLQAPRFQATVGYGYDDLGNVDDLSYPRFENTCSGCAPLFPARSVTFQYKYGFLTSIPGWIHSISYHRNGVWSELRRANSAVDSQSIAGDNLPRPLSIESDFVGDGRKIGPYSYDAAGNVASIGANNATVDTFRYDRVGRIVTATIKNITETFSYDRYGNLTNVGMLQLSPVAATNRLANVQYDAAGNLRGRTWNDDSTSRYVYDAFNMMTHHAETLGTAVKQGKVFLYDANDERVAVVDYVSGAPKLIERWSVRDAAGRVLREGTRDGQGAWRYDDYVYRGSSVIAQVRQPAPGAAEEVRHFHHDHLGSVRFVSDAAGRLADQRKFLAFGAEISQHADVNHFKYTGHERDDDGTASQHDDLDYMHARYYNAVGGRFLSIDPLLGVAALPQSWNRYTYVQNNPLMGTDPSGRSGVRADATADIEQQPQAERQERTSRQASAEEVQRAKELQEMKREAEAAGGINPGGEVTRYEPLRHPKTGLPQTVNQDAMEDTANLLAGASAGSGAETLGTTALKAVGAYSADLQRKTSLIDRESKAYNAGSIAGTLASGVAGSKAQAPTLEKLREILKALFK